jgi:hypothetical protein
MSLTSSNNVAVPQAMRRLQKQTWVELRRLFVSGWSLGQLSKRFNIPKGTLCARAAKERWSRERVEGQTLHDTKITFSEDPRLAEIQALVHDCKLAALEAEARTAKALALKASLDGGRTFTMCNTSHHRKDRYNESAVGSAIFQYGGRPNLSFYANLQSTFR